jgi:hypothetical protein
MSSPLSVRSSVAEPCGSQNPNCLVACSKFSHASGTAKRFLVGGDFFALSGALTLAAGAAVATFGAALGEGVAGGGLAAALAFAGADALAGAAAALFGAELASAFASAFFSPQPSRLEAVKRVSVASQV